MIKKRLLALMADSKKYIFRNVFWQWCGLLMSVFIMTAAGRIAEAAWSGQLRTETLLYAAAAVVCAACARVCFVRAAARAGAMAGVEVKKTLRMSLYRKLTGFGANYYEKVPTAEAVQVAAEGVEQLEIYFSQYLPQLFYSLLAPLTLFCALSFYSLRASLALLVCVPLIPVTIMAVQKLARRLLDKYWGIYTGLGDSFLDNLQGLTTLKIYQADGVKAEEMDKEAERFRKITMKVLTMQLNSIIVMDLIAYGGAALGMALCLLEFRAGAVSLAGTVTIILLSAEFFIPMRLLGSFFHIAMNGMAACDKLFGILDLPEEKKGTAEFGAAAEKPGTSAVANEAAAETASVHAAVETVETVPAHAEEIRAASGRAARETETSASARCAERGIVLCDVRFSFEPGRQILDGISLTIPPRGMTALVGTSGCGKSTIAGILTGRNRAYSGQVFADGTALSDVSEESLMRHVTLVSHDSYLFKGTVEENLRMAAPDASDAALWAALSEAALADWVRGQGGLSARIAERGANLSGGQRQRLALARALLHDTPYYVFDEATSSIDAESEEQIMQVIRRLCRTHAVLLISHRLANVEQADEICLLSHGKIAEQGTHAELMRRHGAYAALYESQRALEQYGSAAKPKAPDRRFASAETARYAGANAAAHIAGTAVQCGLENDTASDEASDVQEERKRYA